MNDAWSVEMFLKCETVLRSRECPQATVGTALTNREHLVEAVPTVQCTTVRCSDWKDSQRGSLCCLYVAPEPDAFS